jgi:hypothetical protein
MVGWSIRISARVAELNRRQRPFHDDGVFFAVLVVVHGREAETGAQARFDW